MVQSQPVSLFDGDGSPQLALFDYAALDSETRIVVQQRTTEVES